MYPKHRDLSFSIIEFIIYIAINTYKHLVISPEVSIFHPATQAVRVILGIPGFAAGAGLCRVRHLRAVDAHVGRPRGSVVADAAALLGTPRLLVHLKQTKRGWEEYDGNDGWDLRMEIYS